MAEGGQYKKEWLNGQHQTKYNLFRFTKDRFNVGVKWLEENSDGTLDWKHPKTLPDKIAHEKLYNWNNATKTLWSDRIAVYEEIDALGLSDYSLPLLFSAYADKCPFTEDVLKNLDTDVKKVIVKCNHGSGWNIVVDLTKPETFKYTVDKMNEWLSLNYAYICGEYHYERIKPGYVIQPLICSAPPIDYMFYYEKGKLIAVDIHQKVSHVMIKHYFFGNVDGTPTDWYIGMNPIFKHAPKMFVDAMSACEPVAAQIADEIKGLVRVDFFYENSKPYFVEATFTSNAGVNDFTKNVV